MIYLHLLLLPVSDDLLPNLVGLLIQVSHFLEFLFSDSGLHVQVELLLEFDRLLLFCIKTFGFLRDVLAGVWRHHLVLSVIC